MSEKPFNEVFEERLTNHRVLKTIPEAVRADLLKDFVSWDALLAYGGENNLAALQSDYELDERQANALRNVALSQQGSSVPSEKPPGAVVSSGFPQYPKSGAALPAPAGTEVRRVLYTPSPSPLADLVAFKLPDRFYCDWCFFELTTVTEGTCPGCRGTIVADEAHHCFACGELVLSGGRFCANCGADQQAPEEFQLVTVAARMESPQYKSGRSLTASEGRSLLRLVRGYMQDATTVAEMVADARRNDWLKNALEGGRPGGQGPFFPAAVIAEEAPTPGGTGDSTEFDSVRIFEQLGWYHTKAQLHTLCFYLGVRYEDFGEGGRDVLARELVEYMAARNRLPDLVAQMRKDGAIDSTPSVEITSRGTMRPQGLPAADWAKVQGIDKAMDALDTQLEKGQIDIGRHLRLKQDYESQKAALLAQ